MSHYVIGIYDPNPNMAWEEFVWSINLAKPLQISQPTVTH